MAGVILVLFLVVPFVEIYGVIQVAQVIGTPETIALMVLVAIAGAWLCKREGLGVVRRMNRQIAQGMLPTGELADGFLILLAGALMLTPGFLTDLLGLVLLIPPTRVLARRVLLRWLHQRVETGSYGAASVGRFVWFGPVVSSSARFGGDVIDAESEEVDPQAATAAQSGRSELDR
ncbi:MAG: FxsA family protein [Acidimicrobiales bacterium]|nr:FxsA family protein [Acidimicrobiales bacterium]